MHGTAARIIVIVVADEPCGGKYIDMVLFNLRPRVSAHAILYTLFEVESAYLTFRQEHPTA